MGAVLTLLGHAAAALVALILFRAAWHKVTAFAKVTGFAQGYGLLSERWIPVAVRGLAGAELLAAALLAVPATRLVGGALAAALFAGYAVAMALALRAGRRTIDCGCGGPPQLVSGLTVARNLLLAALALALTQAPALPVGLPGSLAALGVAGTLLLSLSVAETLDGNLARLRRTARTPSGTETEA